jgi:hypothetical protein
VCNLTVSCVIDGGPSGAGSTITVDDGTGFWPNARVTYASTPGAPDVNPLNVSFYINGVYLGAHNGYINNGTSYTFWTGPFNGSAGTYSVLAVLSGPAQGVSASCPGTLIVRPIALSCGPLSPGAAEPTETGVNIIVGFHNDSSTGTLTGSSMTVTSSVINGGAATPTAFVPNPLGPGRDASSGSGLLLGNMPATPGPVTVTWTINGGNAPPGGKTCSGTIKVTARPYLRVYGADVRSCSSDINAWGSSAGVGAGAEYGVTAAAGVNGFSSAMQRTGFPQYPNGLTFANTTGGTFGGNFGVGTCMPNYWTTLKQTSIPISGGGAISLAASGQAEYDGDSTIAQQVVGTRLTVFVKGRLNINGAGITYGAGPWATTAVIPYLTMVTCGDIYIDNTVTDLTGWYIALPNASCGGGAGGGNIYTCTTGYGFIATPSLYASCKTTLTVRGSFSANQIKFLRTNGTLRAGSPLEPKSSANIAEKFIYGAESWVGQPVQRPALPGVGGTKFESISGLPPVL